MRLRCDAMCDGAATSRLRERDEGATIKRVCRGGLLVDRIAMVSLRWMQALGWAAGAACACVPIVMVVYLAVLLSGPMPLILGIWCVTGWLGWGWLWWLRAFSRDDAPMWGVDGRGTDLLFGLSVGFFFGPVSLCFAVWFAARKRLGIR